MRTSISMHVAKKNLNSHAVRGFSLLANLRDKRVRTPPEPPVMCGASFDHRGFSKNVAPRTFFRSSLFGSRGHRMRRHRWSLKRHNKVPANHVASQKLPYPSLVAGAGRKHLPDGTPKPQTKWKTIREKSTNTPSISVSSNG